MSDAEPFTAAVRLELASLPVPSEREARAELAGMLLVARPDADPDGRRARELAGLRAGDVPLARLCEDDVFRLDVPSSAVARRGIALVSRAFGMRPRLSAISTTGRWPRPPAYRVSLPAEVVRAREASRGPQPYLAGDLDGGADVETVALLRGAVLVGGSVSAPDRPVHLELSGIAASTAPLLAAALQQIVPSASPHHDARRRRIVIKSGDVVADLLASLGATRAFLTYDDRRLRRQLRGEANRLANADAANLARIAARAGAQLDAIEAVVAAEGWDVFDEDLRAVALARIANPSASISELAQLLGVPRTTLHRRLQGVELIARRGLEEAAGPSDSV
jgi:cell division protein WhiA